MTSAPAPFLKWEYARLESTASGVNVVFTHREPWLGLSADSFFDTLRRMGDEGWELVSAVPLAAGADFESGPGAPADPRGPVDPRSGGGAPTLQRMRLRLETDRWLVFKRPQPPDPEKGQGQAADLVKDLVQRQLLRGRLPLP